MSEMERFICFSSSFVRDLGGPNLRRGSISAGAFGPGDPNLL